jgi:hypothetical protein
LLDAVLGAHERGTYKKVSWREFYAPTYKKCGLVRFPDPDVAWTPTRLALVLSILVRRRVCIPLQADRVPVPEASLPFALSECLICSSYLAFSLLEFITPLMVTASFFNLYLL